MAGATARVEDLLAALPMPAVAIDGADRIAAINAGGLALLGQGRVGRHFMTILRHPPLVEAVEQCRDTQRPCSTTYLSRAGDSDLTHEVSLAPVAGTDILLLTFQDVSDKAQAGQMRRDFVANVSHELRTPLTALMGFIETLRGPARDDAAARERFLAIMTGEAERMNRLVGDLLSLSRVEAEERVRPTDLLDLRDVLALTLRNLMPLAQDNNVTLNAPLGDAPLPVRGDADQLTQVFTNLIENAVKYGGRDRAVTITVETSPYDAAMRGPSCRVTIADQGPGIDPVHLPRLTERFYRADSHRSRALGGTGLGLAIVKHILNRHRGRLRIASTPGQGAQFSVILPSDGAATLATTEKA